MKEGIYIMSAEEYHANPGGIPFLSASAICTLLNESPLHAWHNHSALNPNYEPEESKESYDIGTAAHALILEGLDKIIELDFPDWRTKAAREQREVARASGMLPLLIKEAEGVRAMVESAQRALKCTMDSSFDDGDAEQTLIWQDKETGVWCKARLDWTHKKRIGILDFKSTQASAEPKQATRRIMDGMHGYVQAAWYKRGLMHLTGADAAFIFMCQESKPPHACSFIQATNSYLAIGQSKVEKALMIWRQCLDTGVWPGYEREIYRPELSPWIERDWLQRLEEDDQ